MSARDVTPRDVTPRVHVAGDATRDAHVCTTAAMGTTVSVQVLGHGTSSRARNERRRAAERAMAWFERVESVCSRFIAESELRQLSTRIGEAVVASDMLFEVVQFALAVADATGGKFDPTVGHRMEARGFNRSHRTGDVVSAMINAPTDISYRDVSLDANARTITLHRALVLDLGAVAKGLAIDMAARELASFGDFAINAGGDLYLGGRNADGAPWAVGIRHPREHEQLIDTVHVSDAAVCTSGDYERKDHILDPSSGNAANGVASVTVIAPSAMVADAMATAAFVMGPDDGIALLAEQELAGLLVTTQLERFTTDFWHHD